MKIAYRKIMMPPLDELKPYLERIWRSGIVTNQGPVEKELEEALCEFLGVRYISLVSNGTTALMLGFRVLGLKGEVVTSPFTFPATAQALVWNGLTPVFADIDFGNFNLSPEAVIGVITSQTSAILPVHIFGHPCDIEGFNDISRINGLKTVYDAAHTFGSLYHGRALGSFGDLSVISFHATKVFSTLEGGAVICHDCATKEQLDMLKNNGLNHLHQVNGYGFNAKMTELQAACGLVGLRYSRKIISEQRDITAQYIKMLNDIPGIRFPAFHQDEEYNFSFFPVLINRQEYGRSRDELADLLLGREIETRKYFHPLLSSSKYFCRTTPRLPVAGQVAGDILCLPLYPGLNKNELQWIADSIRDFKTAAL